MPSETGRFRRSDRILRSREFQYVISKGRRSASRNFVVFVEESSDTVERARRVGITVSKKVGNSVTRNRVKRRIRAWFRGDRQKLPAGAELVVIARPGARDLDWDGLRDELNRAIARRAAS